MNFTVGAGQVVGSIKFAWGITIGIDIVNVWNVNPQVVNLTAPDLITPVPEASNYAMTLAASDRDDAVGNFAKSAVSAVAVR